jgi:hypothetical protein
MTSYLSVCLKSTEGGILHTLETGMNGLGDVLQETAKAFGQGKAHWRGMGQARGTGFRAMSSSLTAQGAWDIKVRLQNPSG